jgi:hypothetical protein
MRLFPRGFLTFLVWTVSLSCENQAHYNCGVSVDILIIGKKKSPSSCFGVADYPGQGETRCFTALK